MAVPPPEAVLAPLKSIGSLPLAARQLKMSWYFLFNQLPESERSLGWLIPRLWRDWSPGYDAEEDLAGRNPGEHRGTKGGHRTEENRAAMDQVGSAQGSGDRGEDQHRFEAFAEDDHRGVEDCGAVAHRPTGRLRRIGRPGRGRGHQVDQPRNQAESEDVPGEARGKRQLPAATGSLIAESLSVGG